MNMLQKIRAMRKRLRILNEKEMLSYEMDMCMGGGECSDLIIDSYERSRQKTIEKFFTKLGITYEQYDWYLNQFMKIESKYLKPSPWGSCPLAYYDLLYVS